MLDYSVKVDCSIPVTSETADAVSDVLFSVDARLRTGRLVPSVLAARLRAVLSWCGGDASLLVLRTWFVRPDLHAKRYNAKCCFTVAECRFEDGAFVLKRVGRTAQRANRLPPVSCVRDRRAAMRPAVFEDALAHGPDSF